MQLIFKHTIKNITVNRLRTTVIILCFAAVSLAFLLFATVSSAARMLIENQIRDSTGKTDIILAVQNGFQTDSLILPQGCDNLLLVQTSFDLQLHRIDSFKYVQRKKLNVIGISADKAATFGLLPEYTEPLADELVISSTVARTFGYETDDRISIPCADKSERVFTIKEIIPCENYLSISPMTVIASPESARIIAGINELSYNTLYINVVNDDEISEAYEKLSDMYPDAVIQQLMGTVEINDVVMGTTQTFYIIFAVVFLMIIFVVAAFSKSIVFERMSSVGTLRSIGATKATTVKTLLLENMLCGIIGGFIGVIVFYMIKDTVIGNCVKLSLYDSVSVEVPLYLPFFALILPTVISCVCSLVYAVSAARLPLRDIIFATKDTSYKLSKLGVGIGFIELFIFVLLYFFCGINIISGFTELLLFNVGACLVIPLLLYVVSVVARNMRGNSSFFRLSLIQMSTKKTSVSEIVLCTTAISLTAAVLVITMSVDKLYSYKKYDCDIIISELSEKAQRYEYLLSSDRVSSAEVVYHTEENAVINGNAVTVVIFGCNGLKLFKGLVGLPEKISTNEIVLDKTLMERYNIKCGDSVNITLKSASLRPVSLTLTAVNACDSVYYDMRCNAVVINPDVYKQVYFDYPSELLLCSDDTVAVKSSLIDKAAVFQTTDEYNEKSAEEKSSVTSILYVIIILGSVLAIISAAGNQTIGFEQRKHEFAVLHSTGISKRQLALLIISETALSATASVILSAVVSAVSVKIILGILIVLDMNIPLYADIIRITVFVVAMIVAIMLTSVRPILSLKKMNTATLLKRE